MEVGTVATGIDGRVIRLGPRALEILARRRRWIRWVAAAVLLMAVLSAAGHLRRHATRRAATVPLLVARRALHRGQVLRARDLRLMPDAPLTGAGPRPEDVTGRVVTREVAPGEIVTGHDVAPAVQYYGVAARVPSGMRALDLVLPPQAVFGGELAPGTRVDLLGAFAPERGQGFVTLLAAGTVLRITATRDPAPSAVPRAALGPVGGAGSGSTVELEVAIPREQERELVLAQAFGRIYVAARPVVRDAAGIAGVLRLLPYLGAPEQWPAVPVVARSPIMPVGVPATPRRAGESASRTPGAAPGPHPSPVWTVDVIEGDHRAAETVPRAEHAAAGHSSRRQGGLP
jgi:Flp pilus assembly protein CpaB